MLSLTSILQSYVIFAWLYNIPSLAIFARFQQKRVGKTLYVQYCMVFLMLLFW